MNPEIEATLAQLYHPELKEIDLGLERMEALLSRLGNPQRKIPPVIHVAGTNGKGSVVANLHAIYTAAGLKAHVYTSPHLVRFNERIRVAGQMITDVELLHWLKRVHKATQKSPATFFEATTAAAFLAFAKTKADITLLEVGMGGRLDATNVVTPVLTIITPISMDHSEYLGDTLEKIAAEKAAIMKPGVPCVVAPQPPEVMALIRAWAKELAVPLVIPVPEDTSNLAGPHQQVNASIAAMAARQLGIPESAVQQGIHSAVWPGRLQRLEEGVLAALVPQGAQLWLDGAHNEAGAWALLSWLEAEQTRIHLIFGMMRRKDPEAFLRILAPRAESLTAVDIPGESDSYPRARLAEVGRSIGIPSRQAPSMEAAIKGLSLKNESKVLICGSLYLAGKVLEQNGTLP